MILHGHMDTVTHGLLGKQKQCLSPTTRKHEAGRKRQSGNLAISNLVSRQTFLDKVASSSLDSLKQNYTPRRFVDFA